MEKRGINGLFYTHGFMCASHPVEVLLLCITGTVCMLTLSIYDATHTEIGTDGGNLIATTQNGKVPLPTGIHVHVSTTSYFLALLCIFLQCKKLLNTGSKYLIGIVSMFSLFSCLVYTSIVGNIFGGELVVLREALPFFILLNDFTTVGTLTKFALLSKSYAEAPSQIAQGVSTLGPSLTLNTLVGALVIGVGTLSGVEELGTASNFGCLALLTHYLIFMTFLPACLSLFLELCDRGSSQPHWQQDLSEEQSTDEHEHVPNPLLQQVKLIMSAGLMFVHVHSRLIRPDNTTGGSGVPHPSEGDHWLSRFLAVNAEHVLAAVLALMVATKYLYLEKDDGAQLLEPHELEKHKTIRSFSTGKIPSSAPPSKEFLAVKASVMRKRRSTFTIGDEELIKEELNKISEELNQDTTAKEEPLQLPVPPLQTKNASVELVPSKAKEEEKHCHKQSPLKRTFSFSHQRSRSKSIVRKNVVAPTVKVDFHDSHSNIIERQSKGIEPESNSASSESQSISVPHASFPNRSSVTLSSSPILEKVAFSGGMRNLEECKRIMKEPDGIFTLTDDEICSLVEHKVIPGYQLESTIKDLARAVNIRRKVTARKINKSEEVLAELPYQYYDYTRVSGACCENVIGYMPVPVGVAGPLLLDGRQFYVPMATTEGCLVASTNRGCSALMKSGGVRSSIIGDGMTRGPVMRLPSAMQASEIKLWLEDKYNFQDIKQVFDSTSRFARLTSVKCAVAGRLLFIRFLATTGDAMGMNMLSKGTEKVLHYLQDKFQTMEIISLSGNYCTDKKATSINWIEGRGKSVVCEAIIPGHVVTKVLKTSVVALTELNHSKNLVGSAMAGAIGGFNAHAANIVTALFIATGQDPAQNVSSSSCITLLEPCGPRLEDLYISCTMPSIEVGTIGGGTVLTAQGSCLEMLGVRGASKVEPGQNASQLARIVCGTVLAGELSLLSALAAGHLVRSHLKHNRSTINLLGSDEASKNCLVL